MDGPEVHTPHAPHTGHRWWDFAIGGTALLVSVISLYVAVHHGEIMEKLVAANSWPHVEASSNVLEGQQPGSARFEVGVRNNGVGPARVESLELWDGTNPIRNAADLAAGLKNAGDGQAFSARLDGASIIGQVLGAREAVKVVAFETTAGARWGTPMIRFAGRLETRVCYCSVFDECYLADSRRDHGAAVHVDKCPVPAALYDDDVGQTFLAKQAEQAAPVTTPAPAPSVAK